MAKSYTMLTDSKLERKATAGTTVYELMKYDYGCSNDDTRAFGKEHQSFTLDPDGDYPFFTHPVDGVEAKEPSQ